MRKRNRSPRDTEADEQRNRFLMHYVVSLDSDMYDYFKRHCASDPIVANLRPEQKVYFRLVSFANGAASRNSVQFSTDGRTFVDVVNNDKATIETLSLEALELAFSRANVRTPSDSRVRDTQAPFGPPRFGEYLLYLFIPSVPRQNLLGDLEEEYSEVLEKFGKRKADFWFYKQVGSSLWPLIRRIAIKGWLFGWAAKVIHRAFF